VKKLITFLSIAFLLVGGIYAQERGTRQDRSDSQRQSANQRTNETVTINGTLKLEKGLVAVESGDTVLVVPLLNRYIGFINGLREGANVSIVGYRFRNSIMPTKITINDRTYDFAVGGRGQVSGNQTFERRQDSRPGQRNNPGRGGCNCNCGKRSNRV